ncbi:MAG: hypothetical protein ACTH05_08135 [Yaniella sp.]
MTRLSNYEKIVLVLSAMVTVAGLVGVSLGVPWVSFGAILLLGFLLVIVAVLVILRLERIATQQKRSREEIYQVLYSIHGNDQLTEHQARKTRDHILRHSETTRQTLARDIKARTNKDLVETKSSAHNPGMDFAHELAEDQRLRFNKLVAILDAHWDLHEKDQNTAAESRHFE